MVFKDKVLGIRLSGLSPGSATYSLRDFGQLFTVCLSSFICIMKQ